MAPIDLNKNDEKEVEKFLGFFHQNDFKEVINLIEESLSVDVSCVESSLLFFENDTALLRSDKCSQQRNIKQDILQNSKNQNGDYYISPKIIE